MFKGEKEIMRAMYILSQFRYLLMGLGLFSATLFSPIFCVAEVTDPVMISKKTSALIDYDFHHPDISPDGNFIAFSAAKKSLEKNTIWIQDIRNGKLLQVTEFDSTSSLGDVYVEWGPTGNRLAFVSDRGGYIHLYVVNMDGTELKRLTEKVLPGAWPWACMFSWSPDGQRIVFKTSDDHGDNLATVNVQTGEVEPVTFFSGRELYDPNWSNDGQSIVYITNDRIEIFSIGTGQTKEVACDIKSPRGPTWSPDDKWIGFQTFSQGWQTYLLPSSGGSAIRVGLINDYESQMPSWRYIDGVTEIIFHGRKKTVYSAITMELESGFEQTILDSINNVEWNWASWSPDRKQLAYIDNPEISGQLLRGNLYVVDIASTTIRKIANVISITKHIAEKIPVWLEDNIHLIAVLDYPEKMQLAAVSTVDAKVEELGENTMPKHSIALSPDEEIIAYVAGVNDVTDIWIYDRVTDEEYQLTFSGIPKYSLVFSPDGSTILFIQDNVQTKMDIMSVRLDDGNITQQTSHPEWEITPGWIDDNTFSFTMHPEGGNRIWRTASLKASNEDSFASYDNDFSVEDKAHVIWPWWIDSKKALLYQRGWPTGDLVSREINSGQVTNHVDGVHAPLLTRDKSSVVFLKAVGAIPKSSIWKQNVSPIVTDSKLP
jgi:Tol biopolymer transport system component